MYNLSGHQVKLCFHISSTAAALSRVLLRGKWCRWLTRLHTPWEGTKRHCCCRAAAAAKWSKCWHTMRLMPQALRLCHTLTDPLTCPQQHVLTLEIPMTHIARVEVAQTSCHISKPPQQHSLQHTARCDTTQRQDPSTCQEDGWLKAFNSRETRSLSRVPVLWVPRFKLSDSHLDTIAQQPTPANSATPPKYAQRIVSDWLCSAQSVAVCLD